MKSFLLAMQFLTALPIKIKEIGKNDMSRSLIYFPLAGLVLGLTLAVFGGLAAILNFEPFVISVILVVTLAIATAGLHLDGLADTFDALLSGRSSRDDLLRIMRDPHIGTMGALALVCVLLLKASLLASIGESLRTVALILMCVLSRWGQVLELSLFPCARGDGKAKTFTEGINPKIAISSTLMTLAISTIVWQLKGVSLAAICALAAYLVGKFLKRRIGGITGDTIGMANELLEIVTLFAMVIIERIWA